MAGPINAHKQMAMGGGAPGGGGAGGYDVEPLASHAKGVHADLKTNVHKRTMPDHKRGASRPVDHTPGNMPGQANPDHGCHTC